MTQVLTVTLASLVLLALVDWRVALYAMTAMAFLQDPMRKLAPGEPVYYVVLVGIVFAAGCIAAALTRASLSPAALPGWRRYSALPFGVLIAVLAVQSVRDYGATGSVVATGIGLLTYLGPVPAVMFGYQFARRLGADRVGRLFVFYAICAVAGAITLYLEYSGVQSALFGEVGQGVQVYDRIVGALESYSGIFRSSEIAAWHLAASVCLLLVLLTWRGTSVGTTLLILVAVVGLLALGTVTGRRKLYVEVAVFMTVYLTVTLYFGRRAMKLTGAALVLGAIVYGYVVYYVSADLDASTRTAYQAYLVRSRSGAGDVGSRFEQFGLGPVYWAYQSTGLFGSGVGTGSQGAQQFGGVASGAAEGGLGKIMTELGLPGLVAAAWFAFGLARLSWQVLRSTAQMSPRIARLAFGMVAFLAANGSAFLVATQVFADLFIMLMLGTCLGIFLATPAMAHGEQQRRVALRETVGRERVQMRPQRAR